MPPTAQQESPILEAASEPIAGRHPMRRLVAWYLAQDVYFRGLIAVAVLFATVACGFSASIFQMTWQKVGFGISYVVISVCLELALWELANRFKPVIRVLAVLLLFVSLAAGAFASWKFSKAEMPELASTASGAPTEDSQAPPTSVYRGLSISCDWGPPIGHLDYMYIISPDYSKPGRATFWEPSTAAPPSVKIPKSKAGGEYATCALDNDGADLVADLEIEWQYYLANGREKFAVNSTESVVRLVRPHSTTKIVLINFASKYFIIVTPMPSCRLYLQERGYGEACLLTIDPNHPNVTMFPLEI
jgi:hypothetical protein